MNEQSMRGRRGYTLSRRTFLTGVGAAALVPGCVSSTGADGRARLGVCSWSFQKPLEVVAAEMRTLGLHRIHLALQPFLQGDARHGGAESADARKAVEARFASGEWVLSAVMLSFTYEDYTTLESIRATGGIVPDAHWNDNQKLIRAAAKLAAEWKAPYLTLHAGFLDESNRTAVAKYTDRVKFIADACGEAGTRLLLETGQETAQDLAKFLATVPNVDINFDPANMILYGKGDPVAAVKVLGSRIRHVHVKDATRAVKPGTWGSEVPWGDGEVNPPAFFAALRAVGYTGAFAIEREGGTHRAGDIALAARRFLAQFPA